jgi:hypothetical protein
MQGDPTAFKVFELIVVFGGVLAFGFYELWSLRQYKKREAEEAARKAKEQPAESAP